MYKYRIEEIKGVYNIYENELFKFIIKKGKKIFKEYSEVYDDKENLIASIQGHYFLLFRKYYSVFLAKDNSRHKLVRESKFFSIEYMGNLYSLNIPHLGQGNKFYLNNKLCGNVKIIKSSVYKSIYEIEACNEAGLFIFCLIYICGNSYSGTDI